MARIYTIHKPALKNQYTIHGPSRDGDKPTEIIFVKLRPALNKNPFIVVYNGPDTNCPVAAVSHLPPFARHFAIGLGDSTAADKQGADMVWEELHMAHASGKKHTWSMEVAGGGTGGDGGDRRRRLSLVWTRTRSVTVDGMTRPPLSTRNWKLTEIPAAGDHAEREGDEPILAVFTTTTQMGKCGNLQVNVDHGREFDLMLFVTCLSLYSSGR
ncbi:hypothetical protein LLEC1_04730 [Akanthomyces lecanii]|uniref:Uncharacterized protein n=1 Tax=Cordyceps confragosa TaxID=2714763 RepID=A0A179I4E2_CORDF|nr:hypothetical protein LLEC1_04730 [Akanthomyces lecanii]